MLRVHIIVVESREPVHIQAVRPAGATVRGHVEVLTLTEVRAMAPEDLHACVDRVASMVTA
jgi:hypothetical protein